MEEQIVFCFKNADIQFLYYRQLYLRGQAALKKLLVGCFLLNFISFINLVIFNTSVVITYYICGWRYCVNH